MEEIKDIFNYFDILSYKPEIKVKGNTRFITNIGIITGFISIFTILILSFIITSDVFSRMKFSLIYNLDNTETPIINLIQSQIALLILDPLGNEIENSERVFNFNVKYLKIEIDQNYTTSNSDVKKHLPKSTVFDIPLKKCSEIKHDVFPEFYYTFSIAYKSSICLDFSSFTETLFGRYGSVGGYSTLSILINKCVNYTQYNKTDCYPQDYIDNKLTQMFLNLVSIENDVNSNNFSTPIKPFYKNEILPISSTIFKNYFKEFNYVIFNSDNGYLLENFQRFESYRTDKIVESVDLRGSNTLIPGTFSQITLRCSGKTEIYSRTYMKIPATIAYIGGILQAVISIGQLFVILWSKNNMLSYLIMNIFDYHEINNILTSNNLKNRIIEDSKIKYSRSNFLNGYKVKNFNESSTVKVKKINKNIIKIFKNKFNYSYTNKIENPEILMQPNINKEKDFCDIHFKRLKLKDDLNKDIYNNKKILKDDKNLNYNNESNDFKIPNIGVNISDLNNLKENNK